MTGLIFLKLGGSLITNKTQAYKPQLDRLGALSAQIASFFKEHASHPEGPVRLLLGHGSGSFGHTAARKHGTRTGVQGEEGWRGFAEVHFQAALLNRYVMEALREAGLPALVFPPVASVLARDGNVSSWDSFPIRRALDRGLLPVIYGDVVFDEVRGGTILSTEDLFSHLARMLQPERILLAGLEPGVWADFPARTRLLEEIRSDSYASTRFGLGAAEGVDVTGGMFAKVDQMMELVRSIQGLQVTIFSGLEPEALQKALRGESIGTKIEL
jgi:isopentenyl phosphate kinase